MKNFVFALTAIFCLSTALHSQNAYYDSKNLYTLDLYEIDTLDLYKDLLTLQADRDDWRNLKAFVVNPFQYIVEDKPKFDVQIITRLQNLKLQYRVEVDRGGRVRYERKKSNVYDIADNAPQGPIEDIASSLVEVLFGSSLGAQLNTQLVDATSTLLLSRAESELTLSFLSRLKKEFEERPFLVFYESGWNQTQADSFRLKDIFPSTYALISDYDQIVSINIGKSLQNAFEEDLKDFYGNAQQFLIPEPLRQQITYHVYAVIHSTFSSLSKGLHPNVIMTSLAEQYAVPESLILRNALDTFKCAIQVLQAVSLSVQDVSPSRVWISLDNFKQLTSREQEYFICLLYLQNKSIFQKLGITANRLQNGERSPDFVQLRQLIYQNIAFLDQLENKIADLRLINATRTDKTPGSGAQTQAVLGNSEQDRERAFYEYAFMFSNVVEQISAYVCLAHPKSFICSNEFKKDYLPVGRELLQIPLSVENKEYATAFLKTLKVIETLHKNNPLYESPKGLTKYLTLAADVVAADSADRIRAILNDVILPVGSYRVKRYSSSSVFISALAGGSGGAEWLDFPGINDKWALQVAPFVPIGIDISWGSRKLLRNSPYETRGTSNGIFMSILDIGAIISYRFQMDNNADLSSSNLPTIKLEQLLSPGLFYTHGFRNSPVVWGLGAQLTPRLRDIVDAKDITVDRANAFRFSVFVAIDLPLFTVSAKNSGLPKYTKSNAQSQIKKAVLRREIDSLMQQMLRTPSAEERSRIKNEIDKKEKELKKIK